MHLKDPRIFFTSNTLSFNEIKILHVSGTLKPHVNVKLLTGTISFVIEADLCDNSRVVEQFVLRITCTSHAITCVTTLTPKNVIKLHTSH